MKTFVLASALALALTSTALAGNTGSLIGTVVDSSGDPVAGAVVHARSQTNDLVSTTDMHGKFVFMTLDPETVQIQADSNGYQTVIMDVAVSADQQQSVTAQLTRVSQVGSGAGVYNLNAPIFLSGSNSALDAVAMLPGVVVSGGIHH